MTNMSAPASQTQWYLARDGQQYGPMTDAELAKFIELGHLQPNDLLWREGFPDWRPAMVVFPPRTQAPQRRCARHRASRRSSARRASLPAGPTDWQGDPADMRRRSQLRRAR